MGAGEDHKFCGELEWKWC